jgi:hypothetical protein
MTDRRRLIGNAAGCLLIAPMAGRAQLLCAYEVIE